MIWLTLEQLIELHSDISRHANGLAGVRDINLLDSALLSPMQSFGGVELYPTITEKIVRLCVGLTQNHPFIDGNKRIGVHSMLVLSRLNGIVLNYTQQELIDLSLGLASGKIGYEDCLNWVKVHTKS